MLRFEGESDDEAGAVCVACVEGEDAAQLFGEFAAQGQSEADALLEGVELDEALKDVLCLVCWDAASCVLNGEDERLCDGLGLEGDAALLSVFDGVVGKGADDAVEHVLVGGDAEFRIELAVYAEGYLRRYGLFIIGDDALKQLVHLDDIVFDHVGGTFDEREADDLVDEVCDLQGALLHHRGHVLPLLDTLGEGGVGNDLREAADDVQRCAHLVADVLDEACLHLVRLEGLLIGGVELLQMAAAGVEEVGKQSHEDTQQTDDDAEADEAVAGDFTFGVVDDQFVADALHTVGEHDVVHRVVGLKGFPLGVEGLFPPSCLLIDLCDGVEAVFIELLLCKRDGLVSPALGGEEIDFDHAPVDRGLALLHTCLVTLVAFEELRHVAVVEIGEGATGIDVEHTLWGVLFCNLLGACEQFEGLLRIVAHLHVDNVHVDGWHVLPVAFLFHELDHLLEARLGGVAIAADTVDVPLHVVGHVHLLVEFLLTEFGRELAGQFVGLIDLLTVHEEHDFVAALVVVAVDVLLGEQIVLQSLDGREELGGVALVESTVHNFAQGLVFRLILIVLRQGGGVQEDRQRQGQ